LCNLSPAITKAGAGKQAPKSDAAAAPASAPAAAKAKGVEEYEIGPHSSSPMAAPFSLFVIGSVGRHSTLTARPSTYCNLSSPSGVLMYMDEAEQEAKLQESIEESMMYPTNKPQGASNAS
jgi:hypothetical protein